MEKRRLKNLFKELCYIAGGIVAIHFILLSTGWYNTKVESSFGYIFSPTSKENCVDRKKASNIYDYFYVCDGMSMGYDLSFFVDEGTVEIVILDADNVKMFFDGMEQPIVERYILKSSDTIYWDLSTLEPEHRYALAVYGSENASFTGEITEHYYIKKWQSLYNKFMMFLGREQKYRT